MYSCHGADAGIIFIRQTGSLKKPTLPSLLWKFLLQTSAANLQTNSSGQIVCKAMPPLNLQSWIKLDLLILVAAYCLRSPKHNSTSHPFFATCCYECRYVIRSSSSKTWPCEGVWCSAYPLEHMIKMEWYNEALVHGRWWTWPDPSQAKDIYHSLTLQIDIDT